MGMFLLESDVYAAIIDNEIYIFNIFIKYYRRNRNNQPILILILIVENNMFLL